MMSDKGHCKKCEADEAAGLPKVRFKKKKATCFVCDKEVEQVLDLHHTRADLCSLKCEAAYWIDIAYS